MEFRQSTYRYNAFVSVQNLPEDYLQEYNTQVMSLDVHGHETLTIQLGEDVLKQVDKFRYLGSTLTSKCDLDAEINSRINAAAAAFGK